MIKLNLLPIKAEQKRNKLIQQFILLVALLILIIVGNFIFYQYNQKLVDTQTEIIVNLEKDIEKYQSLHGDLQKEKDKRQEFLKRIEAINSLEGLKRNLLRVLDEVNKQLPHKTWLIDLKKQGDQLILKGGAGSFEDVSTFAQSLKGEAKFFKKVDIKDVRIEESKEKTSVGISAPKFVLFEIICSL